MRMSSQRAKSEETCVGLISYSRLCSCCATARPSAIAHTIRLAPREASPQAKIPGVEVMPVESTSTAPRSVTATPSWSDQRLRQRADEAQGEQQKVDRVFFFAAVGQLPDHRFEPAGGALEPNGAAAEETGSAFFLARRGAKDQRPLRPRVALAARVRRWRQQLDLRHAQRALSVGGAEAIAAGVAPAQNDDPLAGGADGRRGAGGVGAVLGF